jgi:hypothetical protein
VQKLYGTCAGWWEIYSQRINLYIVTYLDAVTSVSGFTACATAPANTHLDDDWSGGFHRCTGPLAWI